MNLQAALRRCSQLLEAGEVGPALTLAEAIAQAAPGIYLAWVLVGRAHLLAGDGDLALRAFNRALALDASQASVHLGRGDALRRLALHPEAAEAYERALTPEATPATRAAVGHFYLERGDLTRAEALFAPGWAAGHPRALAGMIALRSRQGREAEAAELAEGCPDLIRTQPGVALAASRSWSRRGEGERARACLEGHLSNVTTPDQRSQLSYALGDVCDALGDYRAAFAAYAEANALRPQRYDARAEEAQIRDRQARWPAPRRGGEALGDPGSELPVFLVGMPRSGSSLAEQILSMHPEVHAAGELETIPQLARSLSGASPQAVADAAARHLTALRILGGPARRVIDKMPHNWQHLGLVFDLFPGARVVHCVRDPLDTAFSCYRRDFHASHTYATDLASAGHFLRLERALMAHWGRLFGPRIHTLRYEALVSDPEATLAGLLRFLGLPWQPDLLSFHRSTRPVATASWAQIRRPLYGAAVGHSQRYGALLDPLRRALGGDGPQKHPS